MYTKNVQRRQEAWAFLAGSHRRLGARSCVSLLPQSALANIVDYLLRRSIIENSIFLKINGDQGYTYGFYEVGSGRFDALGIAGSIDFVSALSGTLFFGMGNVMKIYDSERKLWQTPCHLLPCFQRQAVICQGHLYLFDTLGDEGACRGTCIQRFSPSANEMECVLRLCDDIPLDVVEATHDFIFARAHDHGPSDPIFTYNCSKNCVTQIASFPRRLNAGWHQSVAIAGMLYVAHDDPRHLRRHQLYIYDPRKNS